MARAYPEHMARIVLPNHRPLTSRRAAGIPGRETTNRSRRSMRASSGYVTVDGVRIHYLRWGDGPSTIVVLHPNSHCAGVWTPLAERLAGDEFTVIAVDLRGHGASDKPATG